MAKRRISIPADGTFPVVASDIESALEALPNTISDVEVTGIGDKVNNWIIKVTDQEAADGDRDDAFDVACRQQRLGEQPRDNARAMEHPRTSGSGVQAIP